MKATLSLRASQGRFRLCTAWTRSIQILALVSLACACGAATGESPPRETAETAPVAAEAPLVEVFVTDWCPYCRRLEAFLQDEDVPYVRKNIEEDPTARAEHAELGGGGIPVTRIGGDQVVRGFRPEVIAQLLDLDTE